MSLLETDLIVFACPAGAVACAGNRPHLLYPNRTRSAVVYIPDDFDTSQYTYPRSVIIHELLHALGIVGHVDSVEFPDSIMGTAGEYIPNLGHIISKIDREVLQIMYMSQRTDLYNDWDEWSDTAFHIMGESEDGDMRFGVALFNGLPQPWVRGTAPDTPLAEMSYIAEYGPGLIGAATWSGGLVGFSGPSPIAGDAELQVRLWTVAEPDNEQKLRFRDIYYVNCFESSGDDRWFHTRDIDYKVTVDGNWFQNVRGEGYEQGHVTGSFFGSEHEHIVGTVKRTDMIAAFGGRRGADSVLYTGSVLAAGTTAYSVVNTGGRFPGTFSGSRTHYVYDEWGYWARERNENLFRAVIDDDDSLFALSDFTTRVDGYRSGSNPTSGAAVWTGGVLAYDAHPDSLGAPVFGNARLEVDPEVATVDVTFSQSTGGHADMAWQDLGLVNGAFSHRNGYESLDGAFFGDGHEGAAGEFKRDRLDGVFGAIRE